MLLLRYCYLLFCKMSAQFSSCFMQCFPWSQLFPWSPSNSSILTASSSSSSSGHNKGDKYEVFISFRGPDVRRGFLSHLSKALKDKQINTFTDSELERGKEITENLIRIIKQSYLSIVIFSQNYADSEYCLKELEKILESMKRKGKTVIPVFYEVDPSAVQELKGNYAIQSQGWRKALVEISKLSGFDSRKSLDDAKLIEDIVGAVSDKLSEICPTISHDDGLFGIDSSIKDVVKLLRLDLTSDVRMVGIWGMGGIGKTTLACKVFDNIMKRFRGHHCFVENFSETLRTDKKMKFRDEIIQEILGDKNINISSSFSVDDSIRRRLKQTKILLVLDDVQTCMELHFVLGKLGLYNPQSFFPGSRIVVTSRDSQVLKDVKFKNYIYEVRQLKDDNALQLLSLKAFGQNKPQQGYENISKAVVRYARGVPLVLVVLGSYLKHREISYWEAALQKFYTIGQQEITQFLRVSYDGLDRLGKDIFLDIACFSISSVNVLCSFGEYARIGVDRLIDKSLLKERKGRISMHGLLRQMGQEIVVGEKENGGQSRLWKFEDVKDALTKDRGTENVEAIELYYDCEGKIDVNPEAFIPMRKLRYLNLSNPNISCPMGLDFLPNSLRQLTWRYYPLSSLPSNYNPGKLVQLYLSRCHLEEIKWSKPLMNLRCIFLFGNHKLIRISDLAMAPNLESIVLSNCDNLVEIGSSLENLNKFTYLSVIYCKSLSHLPELPYSITSLELKGSGLRGLPLMIGRLTLLKRLSLEDCEGLESLSSSICSLSSLEYISLSKCSNIRQLPEDFRNMESLKELDVSSTGLIELSHSIQNLKNLRKLNMNGCLDLIKLPEDIGNLEALEELDASYTDLRELPQSIQSLEKLIQLKLIGCKQLHYLPALPPNLESLYATVEGHAVCSFGIQQLIDISLLTKRKGRLYMHDLLRQMGRDTIVGEKENRGQSRLWEFQDVKDALTINRVK